MIGVWEQVKMNNGVSLCAFQCPINNENEPLIAEVNERLTSAIGPMGTKAWQGALMLRSSETTMKRFGKAEWQECLAPTSEMYIYISFYNETEAVAFKLRFM